MPTYEYRCEACLRTFEVFRKVSDPAAAACEHCGSSNTKRLVSATNFILKGSGWYVTDYKNKGNGVSSDSSGKSTSAAKTTVGEKDSSKTPAKE
ncbi:MAG: zinc ribbon domain-containing protein [Deltaproteobacteria bacterium]|nr:zinc ribbon domain-containing protein [Deltaproteobacteria bacterium]